MSVDIFPPCLRFCCGRCTYTSPIERGISELTASINDIVMLLGRMRYRANVEKNEMINPMMIFMRTME